MKKLTLSLALTLLSAIVLTATAKTIYFNGGVVGYSVCIRLLRTGRR